jgi:hypothetical protein
MIDADAGQRMLSCAAGCADSSTGRRSRRACNTALSAAYDWVRRVLGHPNAYSMS